jgi:uncharacterized protein YjbI with pentapeptide repeats
MASNLCGTCCNSDNLNEAKLREADLTYTEFRSANLSNVGLKKDEVQTDLVGRKSIVIHL